jgi:hypothetical protein
VRYRCMSFGWYQELLSEVLVEDFTAAEIEVLHMLDSGGMIVHAYRESDLVNPELVGRHSRLRSFIGASDREVQQRDLSLTHEIERFLVDPSHCAAWSRAHQTDGLLQQRWRVVDLWCSESAMAEADKSRIYGRAIRIAPSAIGAVDSTSLISEIDRIGSQL